MIYDEIANLSKYPELSKIQKFLEEKKEVLPNGKYVIDSNCYVNVMEYESSVIEKFEAHEKYIDVQCVFSGEEIMRVAKRQEATLFEAYDDEKDVAFFKTENFASYKLDDKHFLVFDTDDLHISAPSEKGSMQVKKYVFKLRKGKN